ncbi:MAG: SMI1/KNR4 family protein [Lachnospiraceae bacterium]|nr:SMI1/KNR4 family protein [Lachnospiraceae bacterium]
MFENVNLDDLWYEGEYYDKEEYECGDIESDDLIESIENDLGFKLPQSYIFLMKKHNGGLLNKNCVQINKRDTFNDLEGIFGLGRTKRHSICEENKYKSYYEENLISICSSNSGHNKIYLDYSICGTDGEPRVIAIDNECFDDVNPHPWVLADNFETFIESLHEYTEDDEETEASDLFHPDDNIHKLVKKKVLVQSNGWIVKFVLGVLLVSVAGFVIGIKFLGYLIPFELFGGILLLIMYVIASIDIFKRKYRCWYDEIADIKEENGIKNYVLKDTERKMFFIVGKKEEIHVGDRFLCITDGYAFKYDK